VSSISSSVINSQTKQIYARFRVEIKNLIWWNTWWVWWNTWRIIVEL